MTTFHLDGIKVSFIADKLKVKCVCVCMCVYWTWIRLLFLVDKFLSIDSRGEMRYREKLTTISLVYFIQELFILPVLLILRYRTENRDEQTQFEEKRKRNKDLRRLNLEEKMAKNIKEWYLKYIAG